MNSSFSWKLLESPNNRTIKAINLLHELPTFLKPWDKGLELDKGFLLLCKLQPSKDFFLAMVQCMYDLLCSFQFMSSIKCSRLTCQSYKHKALMLEA